MAQNPRRRNTLIAVAVLVIIVLLLLLSRCRPAKPAAITRSLEPTATAPTGSLTPSLPATAAPAAAEPAEVLTPAVLTAPDRVTAGAVFSVGWKGPDNRGDYVTVVRVEAATADVGNYQETKHGATLELTAPIEPGPYEVRYITSRSHTVLGRAPVEVIAAGATLEAPAEVILGATFVVSWVGPNNAGDYITIVPKAWPDEKYASYADAEKGPPQSLTAPTEAGEAELRYITGQGKKVLSRRAVRVRIPEVTLVAPADAIAGSTLQVAWTGPNNSGDYITLVEAQTPDGQYGNYTVTSGGSPLKVLVPIMAGSAELRYMTGQGNKVLGRRPIAIVAATITLAAPPEVTAGADVAITWTGPNNPGDYITIVAKAKPDGQYGAYTNTSAGSPLNIKAPKEPGDAEVRYMTGQGSKVLARIPIRIVP